MTKSAQVWQWTRSDIIRELGKDSRTVGKMLAAADLDSRETWTTRQVFAAMVGDLTAERTREARERADKLALENAQRRGELVEPGKFVAVMSRTLESIKATIQAAPNLEAEDKDKLLKACQLALTGTVKRVGGVGADTEPAAEADS
jgi:phage terminase Nu1 subunit (DNA packaging protein)